MGLIPNDWDVKGLSELSDVDLDNLSSTTNPDFIFQYISIEDVNNGILRSKTEMLFRDAPSRARKKIKREDILVSTVRPNLKSHLLINQEVKDWICSTGFSVIRCKKHLADSAYIFNHFFAFTINKQIDNLISGSNYPAINSQEVKRLQIPLPPTKAEQTAIATALTDADTLITQLEKLIAKKKAIKQGAMQELLKPKEGWVVKKFSEVIQLQGGSQPPLTTFISSQKEGYIRLLQIRDYKTDNYKTYIPLSLARKFCKKDDIMIGRYGPPVFQILQGLEGAYNVALMKAIPLSCVLRSYALHFLKQDSLLSFVEKLSQRTAGQSGIDIKELNEYPFPLPPFAQQTRIAKILSDMDAEIDVLETKLEKQKMMKQGMMQVLLTGKIRLV